MVKKKAQKSVTGEPQTAKKNSLQTMDARSNAKQHEKSVRLMMIAKKTLEKTSYVLVL
jgi:ubiquitin